MKRAYLPLVTCLIWGCNQPARQIASHPPAKTVATPAATPRTAPQPVNPVGGVMRIDARGPNLIREPRWFDTNLLQQPGGKLHLTSMLWRTHWELGEVLGAPYETSESFRHYKLPGVEDVMVRYHQGRSISVTIYFYIGYSTPEEMAAKGGLFLKQSDATTIAPMGVNWIDSAGIQVAAVKSRAGGGFDVLQSRILDNAIPQQYDTPGSVDATVTRLQGQSRGFTSKYPTPARRTPTSGTMRGPNGRSRSSRR